MLKLFLNFHVFIFGEAIKFRGHVFNFTFSTNISFLWKKVLGAGDKKKQRSP